MSNNQVVCQCGQHLREEPKFFNLKNIFFVSAFILLIAVIHRQTFGKGATKTSGQKKANTDDLEAERDCQLEFSRCKQMLFALEKKLTETLEDKMLMMEDKMIILQQNRESEERIIHTLATMRDFQIDELQKEIEALKQLFVDA